MVSEPTGVRFSDYLIFETLAYEYGEKSLITSKAKNKNYEFISATILKKIQITQIIVLKKKVELLTNKLS